MNNYFKIYWLTRLDNIQGIFLAASIILSLLFIINFFSRYIDYDEEYLLFKKLYQRIIILTLAILVIITANLIPSKKEAIIILAGGKTMDFVQSDTSLSKIPSQATTIISSYLDKAIKEIKRENKKKDKDDEE